MRTPFTHSALRGCTVVLATALLLAPTAAAATATDVVAVPANAAFPTPQLVDTLADRLGPDWSADTRAPSVRTVAPGVMSVGLSARGALESRSRSFVQRSHVFVYDTGRWVLVADADIGVESQAGRVDGGVTIAFHEEAIAGLSRRGGLDVVAGFRFEDRTAIHLNGSLGALQDRLASSGDVEGLLPVALKQAERMVTSFDQETRVVTRGGQVVKFANGAGDWYAALNVIFPESDGGASAGGGGGGTESPGGTTSGGPDNITVEKSFLKCVKCCFSELGLYITLAEWLCMALGLGACALSGPGFPACATILLTTCGIVFSVAQIEALIACMISCL